MADQPHHSLPPPGSLNEDSSMAQPFDHMPSSSPNVEQRISSPGLTFQTDSHASTSDQLGTRDSSSGSDDSSDEVNFDHTGQNVQGAGNVGVDPLDTGATQELLDIPESPELQPLPEPAKPARKLRTAKDVLNRLRWDEDYDISDFVIVYKDRFEGNKEISADQWKDETTDEEFIPQHRIVRIKKQDNEIVWDRERRVDLVFFSGNS